MNNQTRRQTITRCARIIFALFVIFLSIPTLHAQSQGIQNRFLLIFDTSAKMKKCLPTTQAAVEKLFFSLMNHQLQPGDTIGVWTFAQEAESGKLPLQRWRAENAATIASNINAFVERRRYRNSTDLESIMPLLSDVVQGSDRLTVLIFCDGDGEMKHTPFDDTINATFEKNRDSLQKALQPFVIVLRSQEGAYVGATVNSTAGPVNFPEFPPLPKAAEPAPAPSAPPNPPPAAPPAPIVLAPSLIIIGTNVGTNLPAPASPAPKVEMTNSSSVVQTNPVAETSVVSATAAMVETNFMTRTNSVASPSGNSGISSGGALKIGVTLLVGAIILVIVMISRARKSGKSLITHSMDEKQ